MTLNTPAKPTTGDREEDQPRGQWQNPCDFFVSCLGYAVGLGNVWRFPFLCYKHGGGSFLIPYFIMLFAAGLPVFLLEMILGQYAGVGPVKTFGHLAPILRGLGYAMVNVGMLFAFFYIVVVSWALQYLLASFKPTLGWATCDNDFNTEHCRPVEEERAGSGNNASAGNSNSVQEFWTRNVLGVDDGRDWSNFVSVCKAFKDN